MQILFITIIAVFVTVPSLAHGSAVFVDKDAASEYLSRQKRWNSGFEEFAQGNAEQECYEERCNYEEVREIFENDQKADEFYATLYDQCSTDPCDTTGTVGCTNLYRGWRCECKPGYTGERCETVHDACDSEPCVNGACWSSHPSYICTCLPGFKGENCDQDENECERYGNLCLNGGACVNTHGSYHCDCGDSWAGRECSQDVNECESANPCQNNATCLNKLGSYACECGSGWNGDNCDVDIDECETHATVCKNNATCENTAGAFRCNCVVGWTGFDCATEVNECDLNYCPTGSTCVDKLNAFECQCPPSGCAAKEEDQAEEDPEDDQIPKQEPLKKRRVAV